MQHATSNQSTDSQAIMSKRRPVVDVQQCLRLGYSGEVEFYNIQGYKVGFIRILQAPPLDTLTQINDKPLYYQPLEGIN